MASMKIGTSVTTIGNSAFSGCSALPQIVIPQSVTKINDYVFSGCRSLTNVNMEERKSDKTVLTLGSNGNNPLFADCPLDEVYIGRNISYSTASDKGYSPFYRNTSLRSVTITDRETEISMNEFYGCTNLQDVTIGDGVGSFGDWAFSGCSSLKHFSFGMSVETIGREAFSDCTSMESIFSRSPEPPVCGDQALDDINKWTCVLTVPAGNKAAYQAADQWKEFFFVEEGEAVKKYFDVSVDISEGGKVLVNDKEEVKVNMKKGSDVVLQFLPNEGYKLEKVLVNGEDVTSQVVDGCYTLTEISADVTIKVVFSSTSGINAIKADDEDMKWYTLDGKQIEQPRKGLNIVRMSNGKTKKVLVK
jgi:mannose-6-phosphate isomerase-like protein (cupin superfamily)